MAYRLRSSTWRMGTSCSCIVLCIDGEQGKVGDNMHYKILQLTKISGRGLSRGLATQIVRFYCTGTISVPSRADNAKPVPTYLNALED